MITDALISFVTTIAGWILELLPTGNLNLPTPQPLVDVLGRVDSLVPIAGPLTAAILVLSAVVAFIAVRLILMLWNLIWP